MIAQVLEYNYYLHNSVFISLNPFVAPKKVVIVVGNV